MGSFSFLKADKLTKTANIVFSKQYKFLIPKEFGGGHIVDNYQDYGYLGRRKDGSPKYDVYELYAFWNHDIIPKDKPLKYNGEFPNMKEIDEFTDYNRLIGIKLYFDNYYKRYDRSPEHKYPLKLVSYSFKGTYEECNGESLPDPNQGYYSLKRKQLEKGDY